MKTRTEADSMGQLEVPENALYGAQTQRAINNFPVSGQSLPEPFIRALISLKQAAARANLRLDCLSEPMANAIDQACTELLDDPALMQHFPVDVFQTGSGTSSNMNANEVIATLASRRLGEAVGANDHVNFGQSSNDIVPSAIHTSAAIEVSKHLLPALEHLKVTIQEKGQALKGHTKTGRTHLMDAMPVRFDQTFNGWAAQLQDNIDNLNSILVKVTKLAQGGTAVGTGINAHPDFSQFICEELSTLTKVTFSPADDYFALIGSQDTAVALSGVLKTTAVTYMKIANDLRWMNSGPLAGLGEITLEALQPGSSIMPGKVNPVIPEAVNQTAFQVIANDMAVTLAAEAGQLQLNAMEPLIIYNLLNSMRMRGEACRMLEHRCIRGIKANRERCAELLDISIGSITALVPHIGYANASRIAQTALHTGGTVRELILAEGLLSEERLEHLLSPQNMLAPGA